MSLLDVYAALPRPSSSLLDIPAYTTALSTFSGVRILPASDSFLEGLDSDLRHSICLVGRPCYVIPIHSSDRCYGLVLKGVGKPTPRYGNTGRLCGWEGVSPGSTVVLVEGFKDTYILRRIGVSALPLLTAMPSHRTLSLLSEMGCRVVFVPDNDSHRESTVGNYMARALSHSLEPHVFRLAGIGDFGDVFDSSLRSIAVREAERLVSYYPDLLRQSFS